MIWVKHFLFQIQIYYILDSFIFIHCLCIKSQTLFSGKNKAKIFNFLFTKFNFTALRSLFCIIDL